MNDEEKRKLEIKDELVSKDLNKYLKHFLPTIIICGLFGFLGYLYSKDNNENLIRGAVFGSIFPLGIFVLKILDNLRFSSWGSIPYIIYTIVWICAVDSIPYRVGIIILSIVVSIYIIYFIYIETKNRKEEVDKIYIEEKRNKNRINVTPYGVTHSSKNYKTNKPDSGVFDSLEVYVAPEELYSMNEEKSITEEVSLTEDNDEADYECERCFKPISYEEWENYDMMCEDCFMDAHLDDDGNYHDEELLDKL